MNSEKRVKELAESALNGFDGITRAEPRPFLYTRLSARMNNQNAPANFWERSARYLSRPAVAFACVLMVLLANGLVLLNKKTAVSDQSELLADDYTAGEMNTTATVLFDMDNNIEP